MDRTVPLAGRMFAAPAAGYKSGMMFIASRGGGRQDHWYGVFRGPEPAAARRMGRVLAPSGLGA
jgi:hypothetical protein